MSIKENYLKIRKKIPDYVQIVLAAKMKTSEEIKEAIDAEATIIGENYVQEAEKIYEALGEKAKKIKWHMIGPLQKNKINKAVKIFDCIQTVDSIELADAIHKRAEVIKKEMSVFIEVNIGNEMTKAGVKPEYGVVEKLALHIAGLFYLKLEGLMTIGPRVGNPEDIRPYFKAVKEIFDKLQSAGIPNTDLKYLSMGMSNSYKIAIEEGANIIRLGTIIFGARKCDLRN